MLPTFTFVSIVDYSTAALRSQLNDVQEELETHKNMLANETVARVDFENKLQTAREEIEFNKKVHNEVSKVQC